MKKSTRKDAGRKGRTVAFSRKFARTSTIKTVGLTLLAVLALLVAVFIVNSAGPSVFHFGTDIVGPVAEAIHSVDSDKLGGVTAAGWLANTQRPISTPCPAGQSIQKVNPDGTVVCQPNDTHWTASGADISNNNAGEVQIGSGGAGTLNISSGTICLGGVCKTAWPPALSEFHSSADIVAFGSEQLASYVNKCWRKNHMGVCYRDLFNPVWGYPKPVGSVFNPLGAYEVTRGADIPTGCYSNSDCTGPLQVIENYTIGCKAPFVPSLNVNAVPRLNINIADLGVQSGPLYDLGWSLRTSRCDEGAGDTVVMCIGIVCASPP